MRICLQVSSVLQNFHHLVNGYSCMSRLQTAQKIMSEVSKLTFHVHIQVHFNQTSKDGQITRSYLHGPHLF
jgi:hypothetical protein